MTDTTVSPTRRLRGSKGAVTGKAKRKVTVTGYAFGSEQLVEVRVIADPHGRGEAIDLTLKQARQMVRMLLDAIEGADDLSRHDGTPVAHTGREPAAVDPSHVGQDA